LIELLLGNRPDVRSLRNLTLAGHGC
jgi:hypothetical protein